MLSQLVAAGRVCGGGGGGGNCHKREGRVHMGAMMKPLPGG